MAEALRDTVEAAIEDRVVAAVLIYETAEGRLCTRTVPNLNAVRAGLLTLAGFARRRGMARKEARLN